MDIVDGEDHKDGRDHSVITSNAREREGEKKESSPSTTLPQSCFKKQLLMSSASQSTKT